LVTRSQSGANELTGDLRAAIRGRDECREQAAEMEAQCRELQEQLDRAFASADAARIEANTTRQSLDAAQRDLVMLRGELQDLSRREASAQARLDAIEASKPDVRVGESQTATWAPSASAEARVKELQVELREERRRTAWEAAAKVSLEQELQEVRTNLQQLQHVQTADGSDLELQIADLSRRLTAGKAREAEAWKAVADLESQLEAVCAEGAGRTQQLQHELKSAKAATTAAVEATRQDYEAQVVAMATRIEDLERSSQRVTEDFACQTVEEIAAAWPLDEFLKRRHSEYHTLAASLQQDLGQAARQVQDLEAAHRRERQQWEGESAKLAGEVETSMMKAADADAAFQDARAELQEQVPTLRKQCRELQAQVDEKNTEVAELSEKLEAVCAEHEAAASAHRRDIASLEARLIERHDQLCEAVQTLNALQENRDGRGDVNQRVCELTAKVMTLSRKEHAAQKRLAVLQSDAAGASARIIEAERKAGASDAARRESETANKRLRAEIRRIEGARDQDRQEALMRLRSVGRPCPSSRKPREGLTV